MKTIFKKGIQEQFIKRIQNSKEGDQPVWGKMNVYQMLCHNTYWNSWILGKGEFVYKQEFIGKIFGKFALRKMIQDEKPLDKNIPTSPQFKVTREKGDLEMEKSKWIELIQSYNEYDNPSFIHDFFGKMSKEQIGHLVYKHTDHHLRQFGL